MKEIFNNIFRYIFLFFVFSFIGYIWEVSLNLIQTGNLVNKGGLYGPWLPIYGSGSLLIILLLSKFKRRPLLIFTLSLIMCTTFEYFTSYYLEIIQGVRWWDYSGYLLNLNGRVCLEGAIIFGLGGCFIIYIAEPFLTKTYHKLPSLLRIIICTIILLTFIIDALYSYNHPNTGEGITYKETT